MLTLAFDIYGTLIDPLGISDRLETIAGDRTGSLTRLWREKQLEYTFRRALMQDYCDFGNCVRQSLLYCLESLSIKVLPDVIDEIVKLYLELPAYPDTKPCLQKIDREKFQVNALTNGSSSEVLKLLEHNHLQDYFNKIVSVEKIKTFKPDPAVYNYFQKICGAISSDCWLISSNPFDIIGAGSAGMKTVWIKRDANSVFDPWEYKPDRIISSLNNLQETILDFEN